MTEREIPLERSAGSPEVRILQLEKRLADTVMSLCSWYRTQGSDSIHVHAIADGDFLRVCEVLEDLTHKVQMEKRAIQLTAGDKPVDTYTFRKIPYDFIERSPGQAIEPGATLMLIDPTTLINDGERSWALYLGDYGYYVAVSDIAQALSQGGQMQLVEVADPGQAA